MKTLFRICTALAFCGVLPLLAAEGDSAPDGGKGESGGHGRRGGHGGKGNVTFLVCPNCHHRLVVRPASGRGHGPGGKEGRGPRRGGKDRRPENRQQQPNNPPPAEEAKTD